MSRARQTPSTQLPQPPLPQGGSQPPQPPPVVDVDMSEGASQVPYVVNPNSPSMTHLQDDFTLLQLRNKDVICDFVTKEMVTKKGIILQFLNQNSAGSTTMVGVTRIGLADPRKVPSFLQRNVAIIRQHAVAALQSHFKLTLCSAGILESLSPEDYSISFSWASLTEAGRSLTQHGKPDLALGYGVCDQYVQPILASRNDPYPVCVLNVFIQLQDPSRRSTTVIRKAKEEEALKANPPPPKKASYQYRGPPPPNEDRMADRIADMATAKISENLKRAAPVYDVVYPHLPVGQGVNWPRDGKAEIPDE